MLFSPNGTTFIETIIPFPTVLWIFLLAVGQQLVLMIVGKSVVVLIIRSSVPVDSGEPAPTEVYIYVCGLVY